MRTGLIIRKSNFIKTAAVCAFICCIMISVLWICPQTAHAGRVDLVYITVEVDEDYSFQLPAYEASYKNNLYISIRELSRNLSGTIRQFGFYNDDDGVFQITSGVPYDSSLEPEYKDENDQPAEYERPEITYMSDGTFGICMDDVNRYYFTFADFNNEDLYMSLVDAEMMLDLNITYDGGIYKLDTGKHFQADLNELGANGYFDYLNGVLLGDATTGEIIYSCHGDQAVPIASTTKLMTYMVVERLVELGKISEDDIVTISADAARVSQSDDAVIVMYEGEQTTVYELLCAMLIESSNESAYALAEYAAGSAEAFVDMMNAMAFKLGMTTAVFYNPHGLPEFYQGNITTMVENKMSAEDMFKLARAILKKYPQIEEITSQKSMWLDYLWTDVYTTNSLMSNMSDVFGLKTGTTDAAGKCLVSARRVTVDGTDHIYVAVVFGAEFNSDRVQVSELLLKSIGY